MTIVQRLTREHGFRLPVEPSQNVNFFRLLRHGGSEFWACVIAGRKARGATWMGLIRMVRRLWAALSPWIAMSKPCPQAEFLRDFMGLFCSIFFKKDFCPSMH